MKTAYLAPAILLSLALLAPACGSSDSGGGRTTGGPGATGVTQAGGQDFGLFRQILEAGEIPGPGALDDLGFFAEHKLDYPAPACGQDVCLHALYGAGGNLITGSSATVIQLGLNSPVKEPQVRPPLDLVLAIDVSGSMGGEPINFVRSGLRAMLDYLDPSDRVSIVTYSDEAHVLLTGQSLEARVELEKAIAGIAAGGATNLYGGLFTAFQVLAANARAGAQHRIVFLSDGVATTGLQDEARLRSLAEAYAAEGFGLTTIGVGEDFDVSVMRSLAEVGAGNFYFLEDPRAVNEVFTDEVKTFLIPIALDVEISLAAGPGYLLRAAYGTHGFVGGAEGGTIAIPALFLAGRTDASAPIEEGRRGGGGAILVELLPRLQLTGVGEPLRVGTVALSYTHPSSGERLTQTANVTSPYHPDQIPEAGTFTDATVEKGFVMLNVFVAFQMAVALAADSDVGAARGVLEALRPEVAAWLSAHPDPDIADDLKYVDLFIANLKKVASVTPVSTPPEPWTYD